MATIEINEILLLLSRLAKIAHKYDYSINGTVYFFKSDDFLNLGIKVGNFIKFKLSFANIRDLSKKFELTSEIDINLNIKYIDIDYTDSFKPNIKDELFKIFSDNNKIEIIPLKTEGATDLVLFTECLLSGLYSSEVLNSYNISNLKGYANAIDKINDIGIYINYKTSSKLDVIHIHY